MDGMGLGWMDGMLDQDLCGTCDMNSTLGSVVPLAMFEARSVTG